MLTYLGLDGATLVKIGATCAVVGAINASINMISLLYIIVVVKCVM